MASTRIALTLEEMERFDPSIAGLVIGQGRGEQRALCPLCGQNKPRDAAHRCLSLNRQSGVWRCHRCGEGGKVKEMWAEPSSLPRRERARLGLAQVFNAPVVQTPVCGHPSEDGGKGQVDSLAEGQSRSGAWKRELQNLRSLEETDGALYLRGRNLSVPTVGAAGTRFCSSFMGRPALVFPLRDQSGQLQGAHARYVDGRDRPKARTLGYKNNAFFATANALDPMLPALIVTEAPLDALSLAEVGYPAVALCGTHPPRWMHRVCAFRRVLLAFDADDAGDSAAEKLGPDLEMFGARCERLRPEDFKDWNEAVQAGRDELADWLASQILC